MTVRVQGFSSKLQSVKHLFLVNMSLFWYGLRDKMKRGLTVPFSDKSSLSIRVKKWFTIEDDQQKPKPKPSVVVEAAKGWTLPSKDNTVPQSEKKLWVSVKSKMNARKYRSLKMTRKSG